MPKLKLVLLFFLTLLIVSCYWGISADLPDLSFIADGVYRGNYGITPVRVTLDVYVQNGRITGIEIIEHGASAIGKRAERIIDGIIKHQSLNVDTVTGATISSKAILKAVEDALQSGGLR